MQNKNGDIDQILQACLDLIRTRQETVDSALARYPDKADELRPLLEAATWMHAQRQVVAPRPEFVAESRQRLMARLERESTHNYAQAPPAGLSGFWSALASLFSQKRFAYQFAIATFLLIFLVVSTSGVAFASQWTIPGDALYPVKTSLEKVQLALTFGEARRAQLHITFAERRFVEIQNLVVENRFEYLHSAVNAFEAQSSEATRLLHALEEQDSEQARQLAIQLLRVMREQSAILPVLMQLVSGENREEIQRLERLTMAVMVDLESIQGAPMATLTPTPTATLASPTPVSPTPGSPTPANTPTAPTPLPSATVDPLLTLTAQITPVLSGTPASITGTPLPTSITSGVNQPVPTIVTNEEDPPKKPKKPHPNPPRRPPRPPRPRNSGN
jgi:hypothetical protein